MKKVTLKDVAREAGVGTATVERVLNERGSVRPQTAEKVVRAVKKLNYFHRLPAAHRGAVRIEVILVRPETTFYSRLNHAFERISASLDRSVLVHRTFVKETDPAGMARYIANPSFRRSALIVVAPDHPEVLKSLREASAAGVEVVQIVTRPARALAYVGIDNYSAGRTAAFYMSRMMSARAGSFVAICHSGAYENHKERVRGFSEYLAGHRDDNHSFTRVMFSHDDDMQSADMLREALRIDPNIIGIYTAGGDNAPIAAVLKEKAGGRDIFWVGHELTERTTGYLRSGIMSIVIDQAPEIQARRSLDTVLRKLEMIAVEVSTEPVRFLTVTSENV